MGAAIMLPKVAFVAFAVAGFLSTAAVAGSPPNPGGFGQAVAARGRIEYLEAKAGQFQVDAEVVHP